MTPNDPSDIDVALSNEEYEHLRRYADRHGLSVAEACQRALDRWLDEHGPEPDGGRAADPPIPGGTVVLGDEEPPVYRPHAERDDLTPGFQA